MTRTLPSGSRRGDLWTAETRAVSLGIVILITLVAFENLGVTTAMPRMAADLDGVALYSWPFTTYLATSLFANVLAGRLCDRSGPVLALYLGVGLFLAGLVVAGLAGSMPMLLVGRALQGFGGGTESVAVYVLIARVYPERAQPAVFAMLSAAWVLPSLVGPAVAGVVTEQLTWRLVFLGLVPLAVLGLLLLVPALRRIPSDPSPRALAWGGSRSRLPLAALGAAVGVAALSWAAEHPSAGGLALGVAAIAVLVPALRLLLPKGTLLARQGLPVTILARGLLGGAYTAVEVYVTLTLASVHGFSAALAGLPLTVAGVVWSLAALWPARRPEMPRTTFVRWGFSLLAVGVLGMVPVAAGMVSGWFALLAWSVASAGMGLAYSSLSVLMLRQSQEAERGANASALQVSERFFSAMLVGVGGVLLVLLGSPEQPSAAMVTLNVLMAAVAVVGAVVTRAGDR